MKRLRLFNKLVFILNSLAALLLLLSYALPHVFPKKFPLLSVLSLTMPILIVVNCIFMIYWLLGLKKQFLLSFVILLLGYNHLAALYRLSGNAEDADGAFKIMSYNVRLFNAFEWIKDTAISSKIKVLVENEDPDVICFQDFHRSKERAFPKYKYQYFNYKTDHGNNGLAIFSKYPIIKKGSLNFPSKGNNAIYVDIVKEEDTVRIYNLHLESHKINPDKEQLTKANSERLYKRMANTFASQQTQAEIFVKHREQCSYRKIVCGDFNNTSSSNVYNQIRGDMQDAFEEKGSGFGKTFNFKYFPLRIDFILADKDMDVRSYKSFSQKYSDHFPVKASLEWQ